MTGPTDKRRLGILGGTFDPPHLGHLLLGEIAREQLGLDQILFVPAGQPPHKRDDPVSAVHHRLAMTRLAINDNPHFAVDTTDIDRPAPHYTATLFPLLQEKYPGATLWLLIGSDSLRDLASWHQPELIVQQWRLATLPRPGATVELATVEAAVPGVRAVVDWLDGPSVDLSSTYIREWARQKRSLRYLVPHTVAQYIQTNILYRSPAQDSASSEESARASA